VTSAPSTESAVRRRAVEHARRLGLRLPTFAELAAPETIAADVRSRLAAVDPDAADALNLFRVHWFNAADRRGCVELPGHVVLPRELTGVAAPIVVLLGERFPMIGAHKVLAAYACLVPRLVAGGFDPTAQRAVWPSTGNYCRGGVAISRILGCRGVAVLPEGMSAERFEWLARWTSGPDDVVRTPGSESNVKEIYDACAELERDPANVVFNQFAELANHLAHLAITGTAAERLFAGLRREHPALELAAFVSATGSAGTLGAGDALKDAHGARIVAVEALECPTLLYNGFGAHNIQGIGDKHVPLVHNVMNTDVVLAISDASTDALFVLCGTEVGRRWLARERGLDEGLVAALARLGFSGWCNVLASTRLAHHLGLGPDQAVFTVATDGAALYASELARLVEQRFGGRFDARAAERAFAEHFARLDWEHLRELDARERERVFNLGYFTWVEQRGVSLADFEVRRGQEFWRGLRRRLAEWDAGIAAFNAEAEA